MNIRRIAAIIAAASLTPIALSRSLPTLYALENAVNNPLFNLLHVLDPADASILSSVQVAIPGFIVRSSNGLARHPSTGVLYALFRAAPDTGGAPQNLIATLDPATGVASPIGNLDDKFAGLAFLPDGRLLAVTGDGAADPESLYEVNPTNAAVTRITHLGNGDDGETIGTTPDGRIFHASGNSDGSEHFERVDLAGVFPLVDILTSHTYDLNDEILALAWSPSHPELFGCNRRNLLFTISPTTGAQTLIGDMARYCKGLAFDGLTLYAIENSSPSPISIVRINPATAGTISSATVTLPGFNVNRANGLARHPISGQFYAILQVTPTGGAQSRRLVTIDPATGFSTDVGPLSDSFAGLAFRPNGTLVGVTGDGANTPESLFTINTTDASSTFLIALGNGEDGESITIRGDGLLYHASGIDPGDQYFESLDLDNLPSVPLITDIGDGSHTFDYNEATALSYSADLQEMFLTDLNGDLYTIDLDTGATTLVGPIGPTMKGLAFVDPLPCPGDANGDRAVDFLDLNIVLSFFSQPVTPGTNGDLNNDGVVDFLDLNIVLSFFGVSC